MSERYESVEQLRSAMDEDKLFQSKRKALVFVSLLLLALVFTGAQIKEANTFIFKIDFTNHEGLRYLLVLAVLACMLRYYSYSEKYHNVLFWIWSDKLLSDYDVYYLDPEANAITGVIGRKVDSYSNGNFDMENPIYCRSGFLKRKLAFRASEPHDYFGVVHTKKYFDLNHYVGRWQPADFRFLLRKELKYRLEAWFKYRETLDLLSPYLLGWSSLLAFSLSLICSW
ncbi:hypothetical protein ACX3YG_18785 [Pseudomonas wadenswilerensis]